MLEFYGSLYYDADGLRDNNNMCCVPIGCYYCCAFINECDKVRKNDTNDVDIVEIKIYEPSLTDNTIYEPYTYSDHIAIQMTENPIHDVINV
jgi:hypothetical protein